MPVSIYQKIICKMQEGLFDPLKIILSHKLILQNAPSEIEQILKKQLEIANPKWIENEKMGRWNGNTPQTLRFYEKSRHGHLIIPRGYIRQLILLCRQRQLAYDLEDKRLMLTPVDFVFHGKLRLYQHRAAQKLLSKDFGTLSFPTGSGKTVLGLYMIAQRKQPALVLVHTRDLAYQWVEKVREFLDIPSDEIGMVGDGQVRIGKRITIAMVQTLYKHVSKISQHIGFLMVDECHRTPSRTFTQAVTGFNSRYMLGLSATPWRRDKLSKLIFWHLGDLHYKLERSQLVKTGDVLSAEIIVRETNFRPYHDPGTEYSRMLAELVCDDERNRLIAEDVAKAAREHTGVSLVLTDRKAHCEILKTLLKYRHHVVAEVLTGDLSGAERRNIIEQLKQGEFKVLIATGQLMGEGFDCKDLTTLFLTTPVRFKGRVLQYLGRVLRPAPQKKAARVYDYVDIHVEPLKTAAKERLNVYKPISESADTDTE